MLIFHPIISKRPTSQRMDVLLLSDMPSFFTMSDKNKQPSEEVGEHGYYWMKYIFAIALVAL